MLMIIDKPPQDLTFVQLFVPHIDDNPHEFVFVFKPNARIHSDSYLKRHSSFSFFLFEIKFRDPPAQITHHFSLVNIIHLSKASCSSRVNQKRRPFKKCEQSHSSYTMPEQTWNISSAFMDLWECRENLQPTVPHFTVGWPAVMWNNTFFFID